MTKVEDFAFFNDYNFKNVTVLSSAVPVLKELFFSSPTSITINMGEERETGLTARPENSATVLTWNSTNPAVATVENGLLKAHGAGTTIISVVSANGKKSNTRKVTVVDPKAPTGIAFAEKTARLAMGDTLSPEVVLTPVSATRSLNWSTSSAKVATVDAEGVITPVA